MVDDNKHNILYFEGSTMKELYNHLENWQRRENKRFLSVSIQKDGDNFCCIALSNPTEVIICRGSGGNQAIVTNGELAVSATIYGM